MRITYLQGVHKHTVYTGEHKVAELLELLARLNYTIIEVI